MPCFKKGWKTSSEGDWRDILVFIFTSSLPVVIPMLVSVIIGIVIVIGKTRFLQSDVVNEIQLGHKIGTQLDWTSKNDGHHCGSLPSGSWVMISISHYLICSTLTRFLDGISNHLSRTGWLIERDGVQINAKWIIISSLLLILWHHSKLLVPHPFYSNTFHYH